MDQQRHTTGESGLGTTASPHEDGERAVHAFLDRHGPGGLAERMGVELGEVSAMRTVARMPVAGNTQPLGLLHGGASAALAETVASLAAACHAGPGRTAVGIDLNATHHRSARDGWVTAVASAAHLGQTMASYTVTVTDDRRRLICSARLTCLLIEPSQP